MYQYWEFETTRSNGRRTNRLCLEMRANLEPEFGVVGHICLSPTQFEIEFNSFSRAIDVSFALHGDISRSRFARCGRFTIIRGMPILGETLEELLNQSSDGVAWCQYKFRLHPLEGVLRSAGDPSEGRDTLNFVTGYDCEYRRVKRGVEQPLYGRRWIDERRRVEDGPGDGSSPIPIHPGVPFWNGIDAYRPDSAYIARDVVGVRPAVCKGCTNYHGQTYGGNKLICGIHPYGWDGDECPDKESANES